ncbi:Transcription factor TFIIIB component B-like protein [Elsinoe fawcettii]|nr:Transcription factor TFIIIB component B-like protein [Elsinoe fawcettii]
MDLQTSSAINKSGTVIAPKVAGRRRPAVRAQRPTAPSNPPPTLEPTQATTEDNVVANYVPPAENGENEVRASQHVAVAETPVPATSAQAPQASSSTEAPTARMTLQEHGANNIEQDNEAVAGAEVLANLMQQARSETNNTIHGTSATDQSPTCSAVNSDRPTPRRQRKAPAQVAGNKRKRAPAKSQLSAERILNSDDEGENIAAPDATDAPQTQTAARRVRRRPTAGTQSNESGGTAIGEGETAVPKPRARRRKPKDASQGQTNGESGDGEAQQEEEESDPEAREIDVTKTSMLDLVRLPRGGQTSNLERRMAEIDWDEVRQQRRLAAEIPTDRTARDRAPAAPAVNPSTAPQLRIVNGEIQYDESSSHIDRQAQAIRNADNLAVAEDEDVTRQVNQLSWINDKRKDPAERKPRTSSTPWNDEETDRFYDALRMFGTDFTIISKMFAPKTRRQIKLKFVREERLDPERVNAALGGTAWVKMDLKHFAEASGVEETEFRDPEEVNRELEEDRKKQEIEVVAKKKEAEEAQRQRDIMEQQREKDKEGRDREKAAQKQQRELARRRKRAGRGVAIGNGTF